MAQALVINPCQSGSVISSEDVNAFMRQQKISLELSRHTEEMTRTQSQSALWKQLHIGRLTSSSFGDILFAVPHSGSKSLLKRIMGYTNMERLPWTIRWGQENESSAIQAYKHIMKERASPVTVTPAGLFVSRSHSFLGASSDGHVLDLSQPEGLQQGAVEVKCPCSVNGKDVRGMKFRDLASVRNFPLQETGTTIYLSPSSKYYCQIQGEMAIMSVPWVDFVMWTPADVFVERIYFDVDFWKLKLLPKLLSFYEEKVVPEILQIALVLRHGFIFVCSS